MQSKSIQILFKNSGVVVEKWIVGGSRVGTSVLNKTKNYSKIEANCQVHEDLMDTEFTDKGIFCKSCGVKLKLVPEWIVGSKDA